MNVSYSSSFIVGGTALIGALVVFFGYTQFYKKNNKKNKDVNEIIKELPNKFNVDETLQKHKKEIELVNNNEDKKLKVTTEQVTETDESKEQVQESKVVEPKVVETKVVETKVVEAKVVKAKVVEPKVEEAKVVKAKKIVKEEKETQFISKLLDKKALPSAPPLEIDNEEDSIMEIPNKKQNAVRAQDLLRDMSVNTVQELPKKKRRGRKKKNEKSKKV